MNSTNISHRSNSSSLIQNRSVMMKSSLIDETFGGSMNKVPLTEKLKLDPNDMQDFDPIPAQVLRKVNISLEKQTENR